MHAPTDLRFEIDVEATAIAADAVFSFQINELFQIPSSAAVDAALLAVDMDGTFGVTLADHEILVARNSDGSDVPMDTVLKFALSGLGNPPRAGSVDIGSLVVSNSTHASILNVTLPSMEVQPGMIWNAHASFASTISGRATSLQLRVMPANVFPEDGTIVISMPYLYGSISSASLGQIDGFDGQVAFATSNNQMTIRRLEGTGTATVAMQMIVVQVNGLLHPLLEGPIGNHVRVETLDAQTRIIDQVYIDTSAVILGKAQVILSSRLLEVAEGASAEYALRLSVPPENDALTILVSPSAGANSRVSVAPDHVVFSSSNWSTLFAIAVTVHEDEIASGDPGAEDSVVITHAIADASAERSFASIDSVQVRVEEDDMPLVKMSSRFAAVVEGLRNDTYEIVLMSQPTHAVRIDVDPVDSFVYTVPRYVVFSQNEWNAPQQVTIVGDAPIATATSAVNSSRKTRIVHSSTSSDPKFNATFGLFVPQNQLLVYYEPLHLQSCVEPCRPGWFSLSNISSGGAQCLACPFGFYCSGSCSDPAACPKGTFSNSPFAESALSCQDCPAGSYTNQDGMMTCLSCPSGASCAHPDRIFESCPIGTWSGENEIQCHACPAGSYNNLTFQGACTDCPIGYYCPQRSSDPIECPTGTVSVNAGASPCGPCPAGYACSRSGSHPVRCSEGTFSLEGETACSSCPRGSSCAKPDQPPQLCTLGQYSYADSVSCASCPTGFACPNASADPILCAVGTYASSANSSSCWPCPAGHGCFDPSMTPKLCDPGQYSVEVSILCSDLRLSHSYSLD